MRGGEKKMNTYSKGGIKKRNKNKDLTVLVSHKEVESFVNCGAHSGKDNILFFDENHNNEVFLLLHGSSYGKVQYNGELLSLQEVYQKLREEDVFNILPILNIKRIFVLCCYGGCQTPYEENGISIEPYFTNKGKVKGSFNPLFPNEYHLEIENGKIA